MQETESRASWLASLSEPVRDEFLASLTSQEAEALYFEWEFWARPNQLAPDWKWRVWLILAGRGYGKTRSAAEWVRANVGKYGRWHLIGETAADVRDVMVEGESGLLAISPKSERPAYEPSKRRLTWPNGALATLFSAEEPDQLRGPQCEAFWADEIAKWKYAEDAWDNLMMGFRLGQDPRGVATTTPRPIKIVRDLLKDSTVAVTRGSTYENVANLAPVFIEQVIKKYEGTRLGRQELNAEVLDDVPGALWTRANLDETRVAEAPELVRIVIPIDPAVTSGEDSDETGIVPVGKGVDGHYYVLKDLTCRMSPDGWAQRAVNAYRELKADRIIAEVNNGGDLVKQVIRTVDRSVPFTAVRASRGKITRAEPIAALYEQKRVHHVGSFPGLEDQMCVAAGTLVLSDHGEVPIEQIQIGDAVMTRAGLRRVLWAGQTGIQPLTRITAMDGRALECTSNHPVFIDRKGFLPCHELRAGDTILQCRWPQRIPASSSTASATTATGAMDILRQAAAVVGGFCTARFGRRTMAQSLTAFMFTIKTTIAAIMLIPTLRRFPLARTSLSTGLLGLHSNPLKYAAREPRPAGKPGRTGPSPANIADAKSEREATAGASFALSTVRDVAAVLLPPQPVYNLTVEGQPEFIANGILVHNCQFTPDGYDGSPDRVDALVWGLTEIAGGNTWSAWA